MQGLCAIAAEDVEMEQQSLAPLNVKHYTFKITMEIYYYCLFGVNKLFFLRFP